jgi:pyridinium-3,5-biscarboxylic acid mononucleotide sulfurtransferase
VLRKYKRVLLAYSGGVDSTFLLHEAIKELGRENVLAVTAVSETYPAGELKQAKKIVKKLGARHMIIRTNELKNRKFALNPAERCFYCKDELFSKLSALAGKNKMTLIDASNYSDLSDYRPGNRAAKKWKVRSPLREARLTKEKIRKLSRKAGLPTWNMPAQACLASRLPYGTEITSVKLRKIEKAEAFIRALGFKNIRVRDHGVVARIEVDRELVKKAVSGAAAGRISAYLKRLGWNYVTVDVDGYRTGSLNIF